MGRTKIKLALLTIALVSAGYWGQPPRLGDAVAITTLCLIWAGFAMASFRWERSEDWTYRLGSFLGIALATMEGAAGLFGLSARAGLLSMAAVHLAAFVLSVVGRYQKVSSRRVQRAL